MAQQASGLSRSDAQSKPLLTGYRSVSMALSFCDILFAYLALSRSFLACLDRDKRRDCLYAKDEGRHRSHAQSRHIRGWIGLNTTYWFCPMLCAPSCFILAAYNFHQSRFSFSSFPLLDCHRLECNIQAWASESHFLPMR